MRLRARGEEQRNCEQKIFHAAHVAGAAWADRFTRGAAGYSCNDRGLSRTFCEPCAAVCCERLHIDVSPRESL